MQRMQHLGTQKMLDGSSVDAFYFLDKPAENYMMRPPTGLAFYAPRTALTKEEMTLIIKHYAGVLIDLCNKNTPHYIHIDLTLYPLVHASVRQSLLYSANQKEREWFGTWKFPTCLFMDTNDRISTGDYSAILCTTTYESSPNT